ncbi:MarR family winged helix-turn-helix transcriptional regulator [Trinickia acidisoli]|uniref:MarR family winged helix-turn-helix transcriptional regulator n=1 Tax=Trinickia acidisoli TaxID=2767482 RepID=UPI001A8E47C1|nr:MarR family transcriptional regulator [Trinickia acidisoli]
MDKSYESRLGFLITDAGRLCGRLYDKRAKRLGLTRAQSHVLAYLTWQGEMNQARLAEFLEITPISLTRLLDRMEGYGWVERVASGDDRRAFVIRLTRKARSMFPRVLKVGDEVAEEGLRGLSLAERETLIRLLQRVRGNFVESIGEGIE